MSHLTSSDQSNLGEESILFRFIILKRNILNRVWYVDEDGTEKQHTMRAEEGNNNYWVNGRGVEIIRVICVIYEFLKDRIELSVRELRNCDMEIRDFEKFEK